MMTTLSLEHRGKGERNWVACIENGKREYLQAKKDFTFSNARGIGTKFWYILESGKIYEISGIMNDFPVHVFIKVSDDGEIIEITEDEAKQCLKERCSE